MLRHRAAARPVRWFLAFLVHLAGLLVTTESARAAGLVATWRGLGSTPVVYGAEGAIVERIDGPRQSKDEYTRILHSMELEKEQAPYPFLAASSLDSLARASLARRIVVDLASGSFDAYDRRDWTTRHLTFRLEDVPPALPPTAGADSADSAAAPATPVDAAATPATADTSGAFVLVGDDRIAGFPARRYRSRTPQRGFLGFAIPDTIDLRNELVVELWFAGPAPLLDRYFRERARFPVLTSASDSAGAPDTLAWGDGAELPSPDRVGALANERGRPIAMEVSYVFTGTAADSIAAAYRARHARLGVVADLAQRRVWLNRTRLLSLREEEISAAVFLRPPGERWKPAPRR
jgi:hypothetical protein